MNTLNTNGNSSEIKFPKIKATNFSLHAKNYFLDQFSLINQNTSSSKPPIKFTMGSLSSYNRPELSLPEEAYTAIRKGISDTNNHGYGNSQGLPTIRNSLAKMFSGPNFPLTEKDIFVTNGSGIALLYCLLSFCNEDDHILIPNLGYPFFVNTARIYNVETKTYKLDPQNEWKVDLADLESKIDEKSKFIFLVNPINPLGLVYSKEHLLEILDLAKKKGIAIVCDEIYYNMVFKGTDFISLGHLTDEVPVVTVCGLDKVFLAGGWSIGWLCFYDKYNVLDEVRKGMANLAQIYLHPTTFIQAGLPELFDSLSVSFIRDKIMPHLEENRDFLVKNLAGIGGLEVIPPNSTPFLTVLIKLKEFCMIKNDMDFAQKLLDEENVAVVPLSCLYHDTNREKDIEGFRIMTCAKKEENVEFIERLKEFTEKYHKKK